MAADRPRRGRRKRAVRQLIVDLAVLAGAGLGLLAALPSLFDADAPACKTTGDGELNVGQCLGDAVTAVALPMLLKITIGALLGLLVAAAVIRVIPGLRERS